MSLVGPYTPPAASDLIPPVGNDKIVEETPDPSDWEYDNNAGVLASGPTVDVWAVLTDWSIDVTDEERPVIIHIVVKSQPIQPLTLTAQLYSGGGVVGDPIVKTAVAGPTITEIEFIGTINNFEHDTYEDWNVELTEAEIEAAGFGVKLTWTSPNVDVVRGVKMSVEVAQLFAGEREYSEPFWRGTEAKAEPFWNISRALSEPFWRVTRALTFRGKS